MFLATTYLCSQLVGRGQGDAISGNQGVNHAEIHAHVSQALGACWAGVVVARVVGEAMRVHEMSTHQFLCKTRASNLRQNIYA